MKSHEAATVDLLAAETMVRSDIYDIWAALRQDYPLHLQANSAQGPFYSVTRYDDAVVVLGDHRRFTSERGSLLIQLGHHDPASGKVMVASDPPLHTSLRSPFRELMSARRLPIVEDTLAAAIDAVLPPAGQDEWDLMEVANEVPGVIAAALLGIPGEDWSQLSRWTSQAVAPSDPSFIMRSPSITLALAHHELFSYLQELVERTQSEGGGGGALLRHLLDSRSITHSLSNEEIVLNCYSVLLGANATTPHTIAGTVRAAAQSAADAVTRDANGHVSREFIEEGLRWTSAAGSFLRYATTDVALTGGMVLAGSAVVVWVGAANRDPGVFENPNSFDAGRSQTNHLAFGLGPHYCLGAPLARLTLRVFYERLFSRFGGIELTAEPERLLSNFVFGYKSVKVRGLA